MGYGDDQAWLEILNAKRSSLMDSDSDLVLLSWNRDEGGGKGLPLVNFGYLHRPFMFMKVKALSRH